MPQPERIQVVTTAAPAPAFSYSQGIVHNELLYVAGQVPRDPVTGEVPVSFIDQARRTLDNLAGVAAAASTSLAHTLRVTVYLADLATIEQLDEVYRAYFRAPYPARTTVQAGLRGYQIEIDAIVALESKGSS